MMARTELEVRKAAIMKAVRTNIRLKHSLNADEELNTKLPEVEKEIDLAMQSGSAYELDIKEVLGE